MYFKDNIIGLDCPGDKQVIFPWHQSWVDDCPPPALFPDFFKKNTGRVLHIHTHWHMHMWLQHVYQQALQLHGIYGPFVGDSECTPCSMMSNCNMVLYLHKVKPLYRIERVHAHCHEWTHYILKVPESGVPETAGQIWIHRSMFAWLFG